MGAGDGIAATFAVRQTDGSSMRFLLAITLSVSLIGLSARAGVRPAHAGDAMASQEAGETSNPVSETQETSLVSATVSRSSAQRQRSIISAMKVAELSSKATADSARGRRSVPASDRRTAWQIAAHTPRAPPTAF